jgi:hypothetical protein
MGEDPGRIFFRVGTPHDPDVIYRLGTHSDYPRLP